MEAAELDPKFWSPETLERKQEEAVVGQDSTDRKLRSCFCLNSWNWMKMLSSLSVMGLG